MAAMAARLLRAAPALSSRRLESLHCLNVVLALLRIALLCFALFSSFLHCSVLFRCIALLYCCSALLSLLLLCKVSAAKLVAVEQTAECALLCCTGAARIALLKQAMQFQVHSLHAKLTRLGAQASLCKTNCVTTSGPQIYRYKLGLCLLVCESEKFKSSRACGTGIRYEDTFRCALQAERRQKPSAAAAIAAGTALTSKLATNWQLKL